MVSGEFWGVEKVSYKKSYEKFTWYKLYRQKVTLFGRSIIGNFGFIEFRIKPERNFFVKMFIIIHKQNRLNRGKAVLRKDWDKQ